MNEYTVLAYNPRNQRALVITTIKAHNVIAAQREAVNRYYSYLASGEQMVVASKTQYERGWREKVEATDVITI